MWWSVTKSTSEVLITTITWSRLIHLIERAWNRPKKLLSISWKRNSSILLSSLTKLSEINASCSLNCHSSTHCAISSGNRIIEYSDSWKTFSPSYSSDTKEINQTKDMCSEKRKQITVQQHRGLWSVFWNLPHEF